ncbi:MAG TPA: YciI family protein [Marmoricola sp.]
MAQYFFSVIHPASGPDLSAEEKQQGYKDVDAFNDEIMKSGNWVFAGGLVPPDQATVVDGRGAEAIITDGPYVETKEQVGGFWIIEAADLDEALALAERASRACRVPVEVRAFHAEPPEIG